MVKELSQAGKPVGEPLEYQMSLSHRVLVVEDDEDIRRLNVEVLVGSGYEVDAAADGAAAWEALQLKHYHLLVTDYNMPKVTGVGLIKKLRAARMSLPVILVSVTIPAKELSPHPWLQINATLLKPYTPDELLATVRKVLRAPNGIAGPTAPLPAWQDQPAAGVEIFLRHCETGKFMRCDSVWTADIKEALNFRSVRRAVSFGMNQLKGPFQVLQIVKGDRLGAVITAIANLHVRPNLVLKVNPPLPLFRLIPTAATARRPVSQPNLNRIPRHRILVVDDNNDTRRLAMDALAGSGYNVQDAKDGAAGWKALQSGNNYDLVITDNKMPNMTGVEMIARLRSAHMTVPVIMATGHLPTHEFARKPCLRPNATLQRPFSIDDLLETVKKVLHSATGNACPNLSRNHVMTQMTPSTNKIRK
jgi:DNA-binding response OmpR family regulator